MNGLDILRHGVGMLSRNVGPALRVSVGPFAIAVVATMILGAAGLGLSGADDAVLGPGLLLGGLIVVVLYLFVFSWVAVAWHRYVLKEEEPGLLPPLHAGLVWPYLGRSILIALLLVLIAIPVGVMVGLLGAALGETAGGIVVGLLLGLGLGWAGTRLALVLPATAVERPMTLSESWRLTGPASGAVLTIVFLLTLLNVVLGVIVGALGDNLLTALIALVVQWFTTMLGLSILTTLYGSLVENRPLVT